MRSLPLKVTIDRLGLQKADLAKLLGISRSSASRLVNHGLFPSSLDEVAVAEATLAWLAKNGATGPELFHAFDGTAVETEKPIDALTPTGPFPQSQTQSENGEVPMLLRRQQLTTDAKKHFALFNNPFGDEVTSEEEMFVTPDIRYVRESILHASRNGGFVAVVGESGAGKTTILADLMERIERERRPIIMIRPSVLGMEENDVKGKTVKASAIADAIIYSINPVAKPRRTMEAKTRQLQTMLEESHKAGNSHVVVLEEGHRLPDATLKHLKGFNELTLGRKKLLGIVLLAQPELKLRLSENNHSLREVMQRCEIAELWPLDQHLDDYLAFKLARASKKLDDVFGKDAVDAIRARLTVQRPGRKTPDSLLYPLVVNNLVVASMNVCASIGAPAINADIVRRV